MTTTDKRLCVSDGGAPVGPARPSDTVRRIEFWFEFGSNYSYLSAMRIMDEARRHDVHVEWHPFLLGPIFKSLGMETSPFVLQREKGAYMWRDMERQCAKYGLPWAKPSRFPRSGLLPSRVAVANACEPWLAAFTRRVMERNFGADRDIHVADHIAPILKELGLPAASILEAAESDAAKTLLRQKTQRARDRGVFGAPTFFVGEEMFWGNDRLDDALEFAASAGRSASVG